MSWQKCPICYGTGVETTTTSGYYTSSTITICTVCAGSKIISEITGLPPVYQSNSTQPSTQFTIQTPNDSDIHTPEPQVPES